MGGGKEEGNVASTTCDTHTHDRERGPCTKSVARQHWVKGVMAYIAGTDGFITTPPSLLLLIA
jgi:hypothetical protein